MSVDVVVVNYRTPELLWDFVQSYNKEKFEGCTLTVVEVDANTAKPLLDGMDYYLPVLFNCGFGPACNRGAQFGQNDVILLANADTLLYGLEACHDALMCRDDWAVLGPRQVNEHHAITSAGIFGHGDNNPRTPHPRGWNEIDTGQYSDVREDALSVSGSLYFVKRKVWYEMVGCQLFQDVHEGATGAFLETPHYFEETWCSYHVRAHGYKVVYYGPVQMKHLWHRASAHGAWADQQFAVSQQMFRQACAHHSIVCE